MHVSAMNGLIGIRIILGHYDAIAHKPKFRTTLGILIKLPLIPYEKRRDEMKDGTWVFSRLGVSHEREIR